MLVPHRQTDVRMLFSRVISLLRAVALRAIRICFHLKRNISPQPHTHMHG